MIGREEQIKKMNDLLESDKSEFLAVTGRRRVGKTYLIDTVYKKHISFSMTGIQDAGMDEQLFNFRIKLSEYSQFPILSSPRNWQEAFFYLKSHLDSLDKKQKKVIFLDEVPWMHTPKSRFIQMLAHFWNDYLSKEKHFILVVCGSATSWITNKIVNDKGGLHNRLSEIIRLLPFNLYETKRFLNSRNVRLNDREVLKIYMAMGGIPYYLEHIRKGENSTTAIERLCFTDDGLLKNEYKNLYAALFYNTKTHEAIVKTLAKSKYGLNRQEIIDKSKVIGGGPYDRAMNDLLLSGFITEQNQFGKKKRGNIYLLIDEYSVFYHRFIKPNKKYTRGIWGQLSMTQSYKIWQGYAFESVCFKHIGQIKSALGIAAVYTQTATLRVAGNSDEKGFQIDLIIDRKDDVINLCEIKNYSIPFSMDKSYAQWLVERKQNFIAFTKTKKQVFNTLITNFDIKKNEYALEAIDSEVTLKALFKK